MNIPIAIEIGEKWLKVAGFKPTQKHTMLFCSIKPLTALTDDQIAAILKDLLQESKIKPKSITVSFPRNKVTVRNLHLPSQDDKEIIQMIDLNSVRIVPYHKEEIITSHLTLGIDEIGYTKIILSIIHKNAAERLLKILEQAGLFIDRIFLSSYGDMEWTIFNYKSEIKHNETYLLLSIDSEFTDFIIFEGYNLLFTRSINIGSSELKERGEITRLIGEIRQSLVIFQNEERSKNLKKLFLSGTVANIGNLNAFLNKEMDMPVIIVPTVYTHDKFIIPDKDINEDVSLAACASFLMKEEARRIGFALPEIQIRQALKEKTKKLVILGCLGIYLLTLICAIFLGRLYNNQNYLNSLKDLNASVSHDIEELPEKLKKITLVKEYLDSRNLPLVFIYELEKNIPQEISVNSIRIDDRSNVTLRCQAIRLSDVFKFVTTLENVKYFKDVQTKYTRKVKVKDLEVTEFELAFSLVK